MKQRPKYLKETPEDKQLRMVLMSLIGSIFLCIVCLVGTTWAWFQTTITSEENVINIGKLEVAVALIRGDQAQRESIDPSGQYTYLLEDVGTYSISLINSGSIPGFCTIRLTDALSNTEAFSTGTLNPTDEGLEDAATIELTVTPEDVYNKILPVTLEITPYWGEDPAYTIADIDEEVFVPTEETTVPTESTDTAEPEETESAQPSVPETTIQTEPAAAETTAPTEPSVPETTGATEPTVPETTAAAEPTVPETTGATEPSAPESTDTGATASETGSETQPAASEPTATEQQSRTADPTGNTEPDPNMETTASTESTAASETE